MKFVLEPSLEQMALVTIGISLWNQNDVSALISKLSYQSVILFQGDWKKIEERVIEKVLQLSLPQLLKEKVFGVIKPIGLELLGWMAYYRKYDAWIEFEYDLPAYLPTELCWTPQGTVDRKRTAEVLVKDENLNVSRRYTLACDYFLEDDIIRFWNRLPEDVKEYDWINFPVVRFWSDNMKRGGAGHISYKDALYSSVGNSNKVAAKYFLQKLTPQESDESLKLLVLYVKDVDVLCFLLPEMEEEEQEKVLKYNPYRVLQCFLQWPWQSYFIGVANCMWDFLSTNSYDLILRDIILKVRDGYKDYNYQKLFREFWQKGPSALKHSFIDEIDKSSLLCWLFNIKDKENIILILKDATPNAKEKLIYSDTMNDFCYCSIRHNEWDFLEFFIRECLPSKNEMLKFKKKFEICVMHSYFKKHFKTKKQEWDQLFHMSDVSICKYDKGSVEESESSCIYMCLKAFFCLNDCPIFRKKLKKFPFFPSENKKEIYFLKKKRNNLDQEFKNKK